MREFLLSLNIDPAHWVVLTKVFIKNDFRQSAMSSTLRHGQTGKRTFWVLIFFYFITGMIFIPVVLAIPDVFPAVSLLTAYTMFMIGSLILVEYHSVIISPDDYFVLGYQPVTSQTFFLAKITNILFYVLVYSMVLALPAIVALMFKTAFQPGLAFAAFTSVFLANMTTALAIVLIYAVILRRYKYDRLKNMLAFFQVVLAFLIYTSFFIIPKLFEMISGSYQKVLLSKWLLLLPPTWYSSYVQLVGGTSTNVTWLMAMASLLLTGLMAGLVFSKLSLKYSETMSALATPNETVVKKRRWQKMFSYFTGAFEERVVSRLIRSQFLHDNKFKIAVLGILPLTIFYLFVSVSEGPLPNPFVVHNFDFRRTGLLYLLIFLFPMMLRTYVTSSDSYQASWIFYVSPTDFKRIIIAEKNFLMIYFVLPFLMILAGIFYYYFSNLLQVLLHILVLGLLAHLFLQMAFIYSPDLPFSRPNIKGGRSRNLAVFLILLPFVTFLGLPWIFKYIYNEMVSFFTFAATILVISILLEKLIAVRISSYMQKFEFSG